jgi:hypothetical protein
MAGSGPREGGRPPGWYADPDRAEAIRYWNGSRWTDRRRPWPAWSKAATAPSTASPAPATAAREGTTAGASSEVPLSGGTPQKGFEGGGLPPREPPQPGGGGGGGGGGGDSRPPAPSRRKWWLIAGIAVLAAALVAVAGEALRPASHGPRVLTDTGFVQQANAACASTIPGLRPPQNGPFGTTITPSQAADQIDHAAVGLDALAGRLRALPVNAADRPHVDGWLDGWARYTVAGRAYASFLRQHGNNDPGRLLDDGVRQARVADDFSLANGLKSCTFSFTPQPDPSTGF